MNRLTKRIDGVAHGAEGKSADSSTGKLCRGEFEYTALVEKLAEYEDAVKNGLLLRLPCRVGQTVFVDARTLPLEKMEVEKENLILEARVVSVRVNSKGLFVKVSVRAKYLEEWIDGETGPESDYFEQEKYFTYAKSSLGKTVFATMEEAEKALKEKRSDDGQRTQSN